MPTMSGFHHLKLPVRDVARSRDWYGAVLGLGVDIEFTEAGVLRGVVLRDPARTLTLALREEPERAAAWDGFDALAVAVPTRADLEQWADHLGSLGEPSEGIVRGHEGWVLVGLHDPDGIEIRLYTEERREGGDR